MYFYIDIFILFFFFSNANLPNMLRKSAIILMIEAVPLKWATISQKKGEER